MHEDNRRAAEPRRVDLAPAGVRSTIVSGLCNRTKHRARSGAAEPLSTNPVDAHDLKLLKHLFQVEELVRSIRTRVPEAVRDQKSRPVNWIL